MLQKIIDCLDMRVLDRNLVILTCVHMPTLILPPKQFRQLYFDPENQGQYASKFPSGGYGFLQPRGNIRSSIIPKNFSTPPVNICKVIDLYFYREELEAHALVGYAEGEDQDGDHEMSTDIEASQTVSWLCLSNQGASESLQKAVHNTLAQATSPQPQEEEYYYDSDDLVMDLNAECPDMV